jgi:hypothetical protein
VLSHCQTIQFNAEFEMVENVEEQLITRIRDSRVYALQLESMDTANLCNILAFVSYE